MLTLSSGHSADYLTKAVAMGRESYYTGAVAEGEPPGLWQGRGASQLGLSGEVDHQDMEALFSEFVDPTDEAFRRPESWASATRLGRAPARFATVEERVASALAAEPNATPERRQEIRTRARQATRQPVAFHDATYSVQKSVTVAHAAFEAQEVMATLQGDSVAAEAWERHRVAVEEAIWAGQRAALDVLQDRAGYSRVGYHSSTTGRRIDAHDFVAAGFFQHDNRDGDPQLHIHTAILNRVQCADGKWRTLDGKALYAALPEAARVAERVTEEHLTRSLGLEFRTRPDGKAREIVGGEPMEKAVEMFSSRRRAVVGKTEQLVRDFRALRGREPTAFELNRMQRQATFATRRAKSHEGTTRAEQLDRWHRELQDELAGGLTRLAQEIVDRRQAQPAADTFDPEAVVDVAVAELQAKGSTFRQAEVTAACLAALPDHLGLADAADVRRLGEVLTARALARVRQVTAPELDELPEDLFLDNGRSAYEKAGGPRYATEEHMSAERSLREAAVERGAATAEPTAVRSFFDRLGEEGVELGADQRRAVEGVLGSGAQVESLVGPAGTGKSFTLGALARAWRDPETWGRPEGEDAPRIVGLAASQVATDVLAGEGLEARNITRWLAAQDRLEAGRPADGDEALQLRPGDLAVIDESAMASTQDVARVHEIAAANGAKTLLTGDHRQLAAVGAAGAMRLASGAGISYELTEVRRFSAEWERDTSLRLREGDTSALEDYRKAGRVVTGGTAEAATARAARAWLADTVEGRRSIFIVDTNEAAAQVSSELRAELVRLGRVEEGGVPISQGNLAGVGDLVQARRNAWDLGGYEGNARGPINRETYRVVEVREDGSIVGEHLDDRGRIALPADYVAEDLSLGYASTVHSAQGMTVDTAHTVVTSRSSAASLYVAMTRGRDGNTAYVETSRPAEDSPPGQASADHERDALSVLADVLEREDETSLAAVETEEESLADQRSAMTIGDRMAHAAELSSSARSAAALDRLAADGRLTEDQRRSIAADDATGQLGRLLRAAELAGHDPADMLARAVDERSLDDVGSVSSVLHARVARQLGGTTVPLGDHFADRVPAVDDPAYQRYLGKLAEMADQRSRELGAQVAAERPRWAAEALGAPPEDPVERLDWEDRAGRVAAYREMVGHADEADPLGSAPKAGQVEHHAAWHSAWRALGRPEAQAEEAAMSDGQLRVRVRAYAREETWAPRYVADDLEGTNREVAKLREDAALAEAGGDAGKAATSRGLADALSSRVDELARADEARAGWYVHTSATRAAAERASVELVDRGLDPDEREGALTAAELLAQQDEGQRAEDPHREIRDETDLVDVESTRVEETRSIEPTVDQAETAVPDIREVAEPEPAREDDGTARVASAEESARAVEKAQSALAELAQRRQAEEARSAEEASRSAAAERARRSTDDARRRSEALELA